jgi:transcriptional regulator with XRE-family HTH domain
LLTRNHNKNSGLKRYRLYRGLYSRVARRLAVDRSYVSRIARGERRSPRVEAALKNELRRIEQG